MLAIWEFDPHLRPMRKLGGYTMKRHAALSALKIQAAAACVAIFACVLMSAGKTAKVIHHIGPSDATTQENPQDDEYGEVEPTRFCPTGRLQQQEQFGDYTARTYRDPYFYEGSFEILKAGRRLYAYKGDEFTILMLYDHDLLNLLVRMGKDITGDGVPELVITEWSGGNHCCLTIHIFTIGNKFRKIGEIWAMHSTTTEFDDLDHNGSLELILRDWTFAYWNSGFADSAAPEIILRHREGEYILATDLMRKRAPTRRDLSEKVERLWREGWPKDSKPPSALWREMLDFIYSGNADVAWQFLAMVWPPEVPGKEKFLRQFQAQLAESPYWPQIREFNSLPP